MTTTNYLSPENFYKVLADMPNNLQTNYTHGLHRQSAQAKEGRNYPGIQVITVQSLQISSHNGNALKSWEMKN